MHLELIKQCVQPFWVSLVQFKTTETENVDNEIKRNQKLYFREWKQESTE